jgi:hypothetical protein
MSINNSQPNETPVGVNKSEAYLNKLCKKTFLSFWSFPNVYRNQGRTNSKCDVEKGDGKEICDVLVVFGNHIIIMSDKYCEFHDSGDILIDWSRWYRNAIYDSSKQIYGAERWILNFPDNIFIDKDCTKKYPYNIPSADHACIHRIVIAHGASKKCIENFGGSGSLMIIPEICDDMHYNKAKYDIMPFAVGCVNSQRGYIHVLDDFTLDMILTTLDTVSDFIEYLVKKEEIVLSGNLFSAAGEEELLACYLTNMSEKNEHYFVSKTLNGNQKLVIVEGPWDEFINSPQRKAQVRENEVSYVWDDIIEKFYYHISTGTSYYSSEKELSEDEKVFRIIASANRFKRRILGGSLVDLIKKTPSEVKVSRIVKPFVDTDPYYLFLLVPFVSDFMNYDDYRSVRLELLKNYLYILKLDFPDAIDIIGFATESGFGEGRSEDFAYLNATSWTNVQDEYARATKEEFFEKGIITERIMYSRHYDEYPVKNKAKSMKGADRNSPCPCGSGKKYKKCCGR